MASTAGTLTRAAGVLTVTGNFSANDTVIAGGVTYKFEADPTGSANDVDIGTDAETSLANLAAAINGTGTPGTTYHEDTVQVPSCTATSTATTLTLTADLPGTWGNGIDFREGVDGGGTFSITTPMASGAGDIEAHILSIIANNQVNSEVLYELKKLTKAAD